jgi:hypothetical protein
MHQLGSASAARTEVEIGDEVEAIRKHPKAHLGPSDHPVRVHWGVTGTAVGGCRAIVVEAGPMGADGTGY